MPWIVRRGTLLGGNRHSPRSGITRGVARERVGAETELLAVVKANGYGHGMIEVARALARSGGLFGVANLHEAEELRASGVDAADPDSRLRLCLTSARRSTGTVSSPRFRAAEEATRFCRESDGNQFRHRYRDGPDGLLAG